MAHSVEGDLVPKVAAKYGWSIEVAEAKIRKVQEILHLMHPIDAIEFLLATIINPVICDGCNVRGNWEHRCHGTRSVVAGEQTNKQCQCPDCFVINEVGIS
jgi:hypothetical protein